MAEDSKDLAAYYSKRNDQRVKAGTLLITFQDQLKLAQQGTDENAINLAKEKVRKTQELLTGKLNYQFDELPYKTNYINALKEEYFLENDEEFDSQSKIKITDLIEKDFEFFNLLDGSIVAGGVVLGDTTLFSDEASKNRLRTRLFTYMQTRATGEGSRDTLQQTLGVGKGVVLDLATTGFGGLGAKMMGSKFVGLNALKKFLGPRLTVATAGATIGATADVERQGLEVQTGLRDEIDPTQTATAGAIGSVIPSAIQPVGKVFGAAGRALHVPQGIARATKLFGGGKNAATTQVVKEAGESISTIGSMSEGSGSLQSNLSKIIEQNNTKFTDGFNNADIRIGIPRVRQLYDDYQQLTQPTKWKKDTYPIQNKGIDVAGLPKLPKLDKIMMRVEKGEITPAQGLREMKKAISNEHSALLKGNSKIYDINDADALFAYRKTIIDAEEAGAYRAGKEQGAAYKKLKEDYQAWLALQEDGMGKKIINASQNVDDAALLISDLTEGKVSFARYDKFMKQLDHFENPELKLQIKGSVQRAVSENLLAGDGKLLTSLLKKPTGFETIRKLFDSPEQIKHWDIIEDLAKKISGGQQAPRGHLVHNLMVARLGENLTRSVTFGPSIGMGLVETAINSNYFRTRMAHAWRNNGGRLDTTTRNLLEKKLGFTRMEVNLLQDTMWGLTGAAFIYGSLDKISAITDPIERRIEEIKAGYSW